MGRCTGACPLTFSVCPASGVPGFFSRDEFNALKEDVDFFSLMTYDYSSPQRPGKAATGVDTAILHNMSSCSDIG